MELTVDGERHYVDNGRVYHYLQAVNP